jgi:hypothetical protein
MFEQVIQRLRSYLTFWTVVSLIGLIILFIALQGNCLNIPFERDEGNYAYGAWVMTKGLVPYVNTFEQKPPLIYVPYLLALLINSRACWPVHLIAALSFLMTVMLVGLIANREHGKRAGLMSMWLSVPMVMLPYLTPFAANAEKFMILPFCGLLAIYVFNRRRSGNDAWFWAAVCGMATLLYKQIAVFSVLYIFALWLFDDWQQHRSAKTTLTRTIYALAGGLATFFLVCGYFFARGGWPGFWEQTVIYNRYYASSFGGLTLDNFFSNLRMFYYYWPALFLLLIWYLIKRPARAGFYLGLLIVSVGSIFITPYAHYYIMVMPIAALICASSFDSLMGQLSGFLNRPKWALLLYPALAALILVSLLWPVRSWYFMPPNEVLTRSYSQLNPFVEAPIVGERVAALTAPDDYIYVAGTEPEILYYSKRVCPARINGVYALMMDNPLAEVYQKELIRDLDHFPPRVIVWVRSPLSWLTRPNSPRLIFNYFAKLLKERYRLVGGTIRQGATAYWQEPLRKETYGNCSLMVYELKRRPVGAR